VTRQSGTSIKGETRSRRGNRALKSALFLSAFASLKDLASRAYYDEGKRHNRLKAAVRARRAAAVARVLLRAGPACAFTN
jgi:transposase